MNEPFFINDGYTKETTIPAIAGMHPALWIQFRPALAEQRVILQRALLQDPEEQVKAMAAIICRHLIDWSATADGGIKSQIKVDVVRRLHPTLLGKILDQILGYAGSEETTDVKNSSAA